MMENSRGHPNKSTSKPLVNFRLIMMKPFVVSAPTPRLLHLGKRPTITDAKRCGNSSAHSCRRTILCISPTIAACQPTLWLSLSLSFYEQ